MPLNGTTYLVQHGWAGKGVPLDGERGRGLKKPIALPMKRNVKGLGKERDRATEWWDCVFEAGAKRMQGAKTTAVADSAADKDDTLAVRSTNAQTASLSLVTIAKRQHARKMLMTGFIRGRETDYERQEKEMNAVLSAKLESRASEQLHAPKLDKEARRAEKQRRKEAEAAAKEAERSERKKRKREAKEEKPQAADSKSKLVKAKKDGGGKEEGNYDGKRKRTTEKKKKTKEHCSSPNTDRKSKKRKEKHD